MYLSIGNDMAVRERSILGIFDLDNTTYSKITKKFLRCAEKNGQVASCDDLPKSFLLTEEFGMERVYLSQFNSQTMEKRMEKEEASCPIL